MPNLSQYSALIVGDQVLIRKEGILRKTESWNGCDPWTITSVHTNGTIRVQCGT